MFSPVSIKLVSFHAMPWGCLLFSSQLSFTFRKGVTMANKNKAVKETKANKAKEEKAILGRIHGSALLTSKKHEVTLNASPEKLFSENAVSGFLKTVLPATHSHTVAENTTGKGFTIKVFNATGETVERVFIPSPKMKKFQGMFGYGKPMLKKLSSALNMPETSLCQVRQGKKEYWYHDDFSLLKTYFERVYKVVK